VDCVAAKGVMKKKEKYYSFLKKGRRPPCGNQKTFDFIGVKPKQRATECVFAPFF
jgi:hypothetical protein